jgi:hypothetical protein
MITCLKHSIKVLKRCPRFPSSPRYTGHASRSACSAASAREHTPAWQFCKTPPLFSENCESARSLPHPHFPFPNPNLTPPPPRRHRLFGVPGDSPSPLPRPRYGGRIRRSGERRRHAPPRPARPPQPRRLHSTRAACLLQLRPVDHEAVAQECSLTLQAKPRSSAAPARSRHSASTSSPSLTSLRGVRRTFTNCSAVCAILQGFRVAVDERDVSMDPAFRRELTQISRFVLCSPYGGLSHFLHILLPCSFVLFCPYLPIFLQSYLCNSSLVLLQTL